MPTGAITSYIDVAQLVLYAFWIFFFGLIIYLRREDKREGYPLESDRSDRAPRVSVVGFPPPPPPKTFRMPHGEADRQAPRKEAPTPVADIPAEAGMPYPGEPLRPTGNPMQDAVGPATYPQREDIPDLTLEGEPKVVPMRVATDFWVPEDDPDPRGWTVLGADNAVAGKVTDLWVDRVEPRILFFEVAVGGSGSAEAGGTQDTVLLPVGFVRIDVARKRLRVVALMASQFADAPRLQNPDQVTRREEDRITAYFGSGHLYAHPARQEPIV